ncbi:MAG: hypothetical protein WCK43_09490, partial [bacterium]
NTKTKATAKATIAIEVTDAGQSAGIASNVQTLGTLSSTFRIREFIYADSSKNKPFGPYDVGNVTSIQSAYISIKKSTETTYEKIDSKVNFNKGDIVWFAVAPPSSPTLEASYTLKLDDKPITDFIKVRVRTLCNATQTDKVFITETKFNGNLGTNMDSKCQEEAKLYKKPGTWKALIWRSDDDPLNGEDGPNGPKGDLMYQSLGLCDINDNTLIVEKKTTKPGVYEFVSSFTKTIIGTEIKGLGTKPEEDSFWFGKENNNPDDKYEDAQNTCSLFQSNEVSKSGSIGLFKFKQTTDQSFAPQIIPPTVFPDSLKRPCNTLHRLICISSTRKPFLDYNPK